MKVSNYSLPIRKEFIVLLLAVVCVIGVVYPIKSLSRLKLQHQTADLQWMQMQGYAAEARQLKSIVQEHKRQQPENVVEQFQMAAAQHWGSTASVQIQGEQALVSFSKTPVTTFVEGLDQVRQITNASYSGARVSVVGGTVTGSIDLRLQTGL